MNRATHRPHGDPRQLVGWNKTGRYAIWLFLLAAVLALAPPATSGKKLPRIVSAAMRDADGDARADRVRLVYSARIRHLADRDGRYPFGVRGDRIRAVGAARGRALVLLLVEKRQPDSFARPAIRYRRTRSGPVADRVGEQAAAQVFRATRPHGHRPPAEGPAPPRAPAGSPQDADRDGSPDAHDCAPRDASIHPGAFDMPDLAFVDSNCDGIDGVKKDAVFASPTGSDTNPGTKARPKRQIQAAITAAAGKKKKYVLAAAGSYAHVVAAQGVGVFGGYDPRDWSRRSGLLTLISGSPEGVLSNGADGIILQLLTVRGDAGTTAGGSAYGIRAVNGAGLTLQRVTVVAGNALTGAHGANGKRGEDGGNGADGGPATVKDGNVCRFIFGTNDGGPGGAGGLSPVGRNGGKGGDGGAGDGNRSGKHGFEGRFGTPGGAGAGEEKPGAKGADGRGGLLGRTGAGGRKVTARARETWIGAPGGDGGFGEAGNGGGGGGGGGGNGAISDIDRPGDGGGGGGGGGAPGRPGAGGGFGGGSFGVYLYDSKIHLESSSITAGNGGRGGVGGDGGAGGAGGAGGKGAVSCKVGAGGDGGRGGNGGSGGPGGGGAGGPSLGIFAGSHSELAKRDSTIKSGNAGAGGVGGGFKPTRDSHGEPGIDSPVFPGA